MRDRNIEAVAHPNGTVTVKGVAMEPIGDFTKEIVVKLCGQLQALAVAGKLLVPLNSDPGDTFKLFDVAIMIEKVEMDGDAVVVSGRVLGTPPHQPGWDRFTERMVVLHGRCRHLCWRRTGQGHRSCADRRAFHGPLTGLDCPKSHCRIAQWPVSRRP